MKSPSFAFLLSFIVLGAAASHGRVANGTKVEPGDVPYIAQILVNEEHACGGFIYSDMWVVTTAACVYGRAPIELRVVVGQVSLIEPDPEEQTKNVYETFIFPSYNSEIKLHDIAMINLATRITFSATTGFVKPIRYAQADEEPGKIGSFYGWGALIDDGLVSLHLRTTTVTSFGLECREYGADQYYPRYMICAGNSTVDPGAPCIYDEGSPLVQESSTGELNVVGIMSKNHGCGPEFWPTVYTRLSEYQVWFNVTAGPQNF